MTILLFVSAMSLSIIAAYYAIMGLIAIFSGAALSIAIMGGALELAKLVVSSWLYRNWKETTLLLKTYFVIAIVILMSLTSMGIFGFLSKAHSDQGMVTGEVVYKLEAVDEKIKYHKEIINEARKTILQLDVQVNETIARTGAAGTNQSGAGNGAAGVERSIAIRRAQAKEREKLAKEISSSQEAIAKLNEERAPLAKEARQVEAEVGPIKYIAALLYGESLDSSVLEKAVRFMIMMIVVVFDPLAVLMFIAFNQTQMRREKKEEVVEPTPSVSMFDKIKDRFKKKEEPIIFDPPAPPEEDIDLYDLSVKLMDEAAVQEEPVQEPEEKAAEEWSVPPPPKEIDRHMKISEQLLAEDEIQIEKINS